MTRNCKPTVYTFCLFIVWIVYVSCEVVLRETEIDPFSSIFEKQSIILNRIDSITNRLEILQTDRTDDVNNLLSNGWQAEEKLARIYLQVSKMETKFDKMSEDILAIKSYHVKMKSMNDCDCPKSSDVTNYLFPDPVNERAPKRTETVIENETTNEITPALSDINEVKLKERNESHAYNANVESVIKKVGLTLSNNLENAFNKLKDVILQTAQTSNYEQDNQLPLNESRENCSMNPTKSMASNQQIIKEQIKKSVAGEFQLLKESLLSDVAKFKDVNCLSENQLQEAPLSDNIDNSILNEIYDDSSLKINYNESIVKPNAPNDTNDSLMSFYDDELKNQTDVDNKTYTTQSISPIMVLVNTTKDLTITDDHDTEQKNINNNIPSSGTGVQSNQTKTHNEIETTTSESMFNEPSSDVLQTIKNLQTVLSSKIQKAEEQIIGFKIYQSSALHSHMKEVKFELSKLKGELSKSLLSTEKKLGKKLDSNKHSLFALVNAAVTSITSSTVTSSKATGLAVSKTLRRIFEQIQTKVLQILLLDTIQCPGLYQQIGSSCLITVGTMRASWIDACKFCSSLGGIIPKISKKDLSVLKQSLSNETDGAWVKIENSSTDNDYCKEDNVANLSIDNLKSSERVCTAYMSNGTIVDGIPCSQQLSVICQWQNVDPTTVNHGFNISSSLSDLDSFFANSKYYKFRKSYL